ncbi:MAG: DUF262 domain-containing protein [Prolixibacteraceae bacterium]|nr:DUF262 domain-containing protein [Prolixibacteraceae bacterium]
MKLNSSIPSNSVKLIDLYNKIVSGSLITGPDYQRKLVWKKQHKYSFIETILLNFPFPEIYVASAEIDLSELKAKEVVVDGQQRLTTIVEYIQTKNDFDNQKIIKPFDELTSEEKRDFLNYMITVKDLKDIGELNIKEVFKRINSTNYSLNTNEILNAEYGGGEFAIFCKMLADKSYNPSTNETSITIDTRDRLFINDFFEKFKVFSDNDIKRMYDSQYIMLICATILEGAYFGRSTKINFYLEKYNEEFTIYYEVLLKIKEALEIIDKLKLSVDSYWFNKANLFTLIVELTKHYSNNVQISKLEEGLLDLENKVDIYYNGDEHDLTLLSQDEKKYFEYARQGSHELNAREHRGTVIAKCIKIDENECDDELKDENYCKNIKVLNVKNHPYAVLIPTKTGLKKSILDATSVIREFLYAQELHDYENQTYGPENKVKLTGELIEPDFNSKPTEISLYRSNGRGDFRIWLSGLRKFANPEDRLVIININGLKIFNASDTDYSAYFEEHL